mgnify:CR=1 FL=1
MSAELEAIKQRNARVEADKAWETSWLRRFFIALMTYVIAALYMNAVGLGNALLGALVPTGGYLLSTVSLPFAKTFWLNNFYKKQES